MPTTEELQKKAQEEGDAYFQSLRDKVKELWEKKCEADGVPPDSKFVVFSDDNPHNTAYSRAMQDLMDANNLFKSAGYPGLLIHKSRLARRDNPHV